jgi:hypothetical protein
MSDPLLSSLCRICNVQVPKYTCPRCSLQTCSLACSKRHKVWSSCNGERDPTAYKPPSQLATPAGIDHDYNFLHGIEHRVERSEKEIVEDRGLVSRKELELARSGERQQRGRGNEVAGEAQIRRELSSLDIIVHRAPKGMLRNRENGTNWSKGARCIHWQLEWMCDDGQRRVLSKALGKHPIGEAYLALLEDQRRLNMTDEEKQAEKKRKAAESKSRMPKRARTDLAAQELAPITILQDPETGSWSFTPTQSMPHTTTGKASEPSISLSQHLYLLRPRTPSSLPKVLFPLDPSKSLDYQLKRRALLEFPTIYVLECGPQDLPEQFMLEETFLGGRKPTNIGDDGAPLIEEVSNSEGSESSSDESSGDEDEDMEDGEIV